MTATHPQPGLNAATITRLRGEHYNATVDGLRLVHEHLMIAQVRPDWKLPHFEAGQYTTLGLGFWEPRVAGAQVETLSAAQSRQMIRRAFSVACGLLDSEGRLRRVAQGLTLEFYAALVLSAAHPPALTPRLFCLRPGDRLFVSPHFAGHYTLATVQPGQNVVFIATGTGEAPHNAMLAELLAAGHTGRISSICCARWKKDLAYEAIHRELEHRFSNYRYVALTTREPENLDPSAAGYAGKVYVQEYVESGRLERDLQLPLDPATTHVFLCGSPAMIGLPRHPHDWPHVYPKPKGMAEVLEGRGFRLDAPHAPGTIHYEKYW